MLEIVKAYKELEYRFHRSRPDANGDIAIDDGLIYKKQQEEFIKIARERYSNDTLDLIAALRLFRDDVVAQEQLKESEKEDKRKNL